MKNKLLILFFGIVVNFHTYSQWADITSTIGGGITSTTNMAKPYVFDLNNDNYPDFLVPVLTNVVSPYTKYWRLYKNNGNSTFNNVTISYDLPTNLTSTLGFIDYNGDGFKDLYFVSSIGPQIFKNNNGNSFTDVSTQLGISQTFFTSGETTSSFKVFDYDLDGDEDLLYTRTVSGANTLTAIVNNGTSFSTKVNILTSIPGATTGGINFSFFDMDNDGDFDVVFDAFSGTSQYSNGITTLYRKDSTGYINTTGTSGLVNGLPGEISTIDINQDGNLDIVKAGADCCTSPLYRVFIGNGTGVFTEQTTSYAISNGAYKYSPTIVDFDNDGDFDFSWSSYTSTSIALFQLYVNNNSVFTENASTYGLNLGVGNEQANGVWMDLDKDGDLDIVVNREGSGSTSTTGNVWVKRNPLQGNYINIKLNGCGVNKSGIGAKIKLVVGTNTKWLYYEKSPDGNASNGTDIFHFGLGTATLINSITVYWPNNTTTVLNNVSGNQFLTIGGGAGGSSAPTGSAAQTFCSGSTVADLTATGTNIQWYSAITGGIALPSTTTLVNGTTYYASQTVNGCESSNRLAVTVSLNLNNNPDFYTSIILCEGTVAPILELTSPNGITGTWSPAIIDNTFDDTYTFTPDAGQCAFNQTISVDVTAPNVVPNFATQITFCSGTTPPSLQTTSPNGISGNWSPATIDNVVDGTYVFTPDAGQCAITQTLDVYVTAPNVVPDFAAIQTFCSGTVVPELPSTSPNGITGYWNPYVIDNLTIGTTTYNFWPTPGQCATDTSLSVTVIAPPPSPSGANNQTVSQGSTLANLLVTGQDVQWYADPFGGAPLPLNTPLVNLTTYYASQTINGCESQERFPVIVQLTLSNNEFGSIGIVYSPNPVIDILNIKASTILKHAKICNVLGQSIFQQRFNSNDIQLNMSDVPTGTYFVIVESDNRKETFKVLKN